MKRNTGKWGLGIGVWLLAAGLLFSSNQVWCQGKQTAKDFALKDLAMKKVSLSDFKGKVVLLNFFATWCPPCRGEIPELIKIYNKNKVKGLVVLGVSLDTDGVPQILTRFVREMKITYPVLLGNMELAENYQVSGVPTSIIINREGKITKRFDGLVPGSYLEQALKELL
jgi:thiol-disulfide isomerase/thioredoxin